MCIRDRYKTPQRDAHGNISYPAEFSEWKPSGYSDICVLAERTVDMVNDTNFTDGTIVKFVSFTISTVGSASTQISE